MTGADRTARLAGGEAITEKSLPELLIAEEDTNGHPGSKDKAITRTGMLWVAVATSLAVMVVLIVFILQNQDYVQVKFFGLIGSVPIGIALVIATVGGGILVAISGAARIIQLRSTARRQRKKSPRRP